jgi:NADPH-dependent curcumin reductase CurA
MAPPPADGADGVPAGMREILSKRLTLCGFIYSEFAEQHYAEFLREVGAGIAGGRIRYREDIVDGLDKALETFIEMVACVRASCAAPERVAEPA